jgi:hypothetical protein
MTRTIYFDKQLEAAIQARMLKEGKKAHQVMLEVLRANLIKPSMPNLAIDGLYPDKKEATK